MFIELTDLLTCSRCGPAYGLVLLAREMAERRVLDGWLGCPNCRTDYPIREGIADLRVDLEASVESRGPLEDDELPVKIAALCGLTEGRGYLLVGERLAHAAAALAELVPGLEVIAFTRAPTESVERQGVSRILSDVTFPLSEYTLPAVAIAPGGNRELVEAAARRVRSEGRLVLFDASAADVEALVRCGLTLAVHEGGTAIAERRAGSLAGVNGGVN